MIPTDSYSWHHFLGLMLVVFLTAFQARCSRNAPVVMIILALPGTILHELAHYLVALITGGRPGNFTIIPRSREANEGGGRLWTLGSVTIGNPGVFSAVPSGLAPLFLNVAAWYLYKYWFVWFPAGLVSTLELYLLVSILCASSVPSMQDIRVAISSPTGVFLYAAVTFFLVRYHQQLVLALL